MFNSKSVASNSILRRLKTSASSSRKNIQSPKSLFNFWYTEAKRYIKEGSYPKAFSILFRYYNDQLTRIQLVERIKASKLTLYVLNKLVERKYFGASKKKNEKKFAEFMKVGMNYLTLFHDTLVILIKKSNERDPPSIVKKFSMNLISPLQRSQSKVIDENATNSADLEKILLKRLTGSLSLFGSFLPKSRNQSEDESDIINQLFHYNQLSEEQIPSQQKINGYCEEFMIFYVRILVNRAVYYSREKDVNMAAFCYSKIKEILSDLETFNNMNPNALKISSYAMIAMGNFFNQLMCFEDAVVCYKAAMKYLETELSIRYNSSTSTSIMSILMDFENKKIMKCVKKMVICLSNLILAYEQLESLSEMFEAMRLTKWFAKHYLDYKNSLRLYTEALCKERETKYKGILRSFGEIRYITLKGTGLMQEREEEINGKKGVVSDEPEHIRGIRDYIYQKFGYADLNKNSFVIAKSYKNLDDPLELSLTLSNSSPKSKSIRERKSLSPKREYSPFKYRSLSAGKRLEIRDPAELEEKLAEGDKLSNNSKTEYTTTQASFTALIDYHRIESESVEKDPVDKVNIEEFIKSTKAKSFQQNENTEENTQTIDSKEFIQEMTQSKKFRISALKSPKKFERIGNNFIKKKAELESPESPRELQKRLFKSKVLSTNKYQLPYTPLEKRVPSVEGTKGELPVSGFYIQDEAELIKMLEPELEDMDKIFERSIHESLDGRNRHHSMERAKQEMDIILDDEKFDKKEFFYARKLVNIRRKSGRMNNFYPSTTKNPTMVLLDRETGDYIADSEAVVEAEKLFGVVKEEKKKIVKAKRSQRSKSKKKKEAELKDEELTGLAKLRRILTKHKRTIRSSTFVEKIKRMTIQGPAPLPIQRPIDRKKTKTKTIKSPELTPNKRLALKTFSEQGKNVAHKRVLGTLLDEYSNKNDELNNSIQEISNKRRLELLRYIKMKKDMIILSQDERNQLKKKNELANSTYLLSLQKEVKNIQSLDDDEDAVLKKLKLAINTLKTGK